MTLRLSRRVPGLLVAALAIYFFATNSEVVWLYGLTALLLALIPVGMVAPWLAVRGLRIKAGPLRSNGFVAPLGQDRGKVFVGDAVTLGLQWSGNVEACRVVAVRQQETADVAIRYLDDAGARLDLSAIRRGEAVIQAIQVASSWPLGILEVRRWLPLPVSFIVHPRYVLPPADTSSGAQETLGEANLRGPGEEFIGLREYQPGDSQRRVHWPTTARAGALMVVETAVESRSPARYRVEVPPGAPEAAADLAATVAASLAAGNVALGRPFRMALPGDAGDVVRWRDVLTRLSLMRPAVPRTMSGDAILITAGPDGVEVAAATGSWSLPQDASLDDVATAVAGHQEPPA